MLGAMNFTIIKYSNNKVNRNVSTSTSTSNRKTPKNK